MKTPKLTSLEIAQLAHVSQATVSRALRDSPLVRPETRARIQEIARAAARRSFDLLMSFQQLSRGLAHGL